MDNSQFEENLSGKAAYEARRAEESKKRQSAKSSFGSGRTFRRFAAWLIVLIAVVALGWMMVRGASPTQPDESRAIPELPRHHIAEGSPRPEYNSNPPSSGPHYGNTARIGFREEPIADEHLVHNLEHGDIWIAYHPRISTEAKSALRRFAGGKIVITPRAENETDIALVAWGRLDTFDIEANAIDEIRIRDFIKRYQNRGPEKIPPGSVDPSAV